MQVRWRDLLTAEPNKSRVEGLQLLQLLEPSCSALPARCNGALQVPGSAACGFFVAHWMEQELRHFAGEAFCSMGWPSSAALQCRMAGLMKALQEEEAKHVAEEAKKAAKLEAKSVKAAAAKSKAATSAAALTDLALKASSGSAAPPVVKKKDMEDLLPEYQAAVFKVKDIGGPRVCSKCRWLYGCMDCDWEKTLKHFLKVQFGKQA